MKLAAYIERVSQEDAQTNDVEIVDEAKVQAVPEDIPEDIDAELDIEPEADGVTAELEEVSDIQESMEHFRVLIAGSQARGGLRPEEGALVKVALEHFNKRLGVQSDVLSMEDYGGTMSRKEATDVSLEALSDNIKAAGKKALEFVMQLIEKLKEALTGKKAKSAKMKAFLVAAAKEATAANPEAEKFEIQLPAGYDISELTPANIKNLKNALSEIISIQKGFASDVKVIAKLSEEMVKSGASEEFDAAMKSLHSFEKVPTVDDATHIPMFGAIHRKGENIGEVRVDVKEAEGELKTEITWVEFQVLTKAIAQYAADYDAFLSTVEGHTKVLMDNYRNDSVNAWQAKSDSDANAKKALDAYTKLAKVMNNIGGLLDRADEVETDLARLVRVVQKRHGGGNKAHAE